MKVDPLSVVLMNAYLQEPAMNSLFVYELDGEAYPTTAQTFSRDLDWYYQSQAECEAEARIARLYGDCGMEI